MAMRQGPVCLAHAALSKGIECDMARRREDSSRLKSHSDKIATEIKAFWKGNVDGIQRPVSEVLLMQQKLPHLLSPAVLCALETVPEQLGEPPK